jgi:hypothetical protein
VCPYSHSIFEYWMHPARWVLPPTLQAVCKCLVALP